MKVLVEVESHALGDSVGAVAVISKYQTQNNYPNLFTKSYPNLKFINRDEPISDFFNDKINTTYKFDAPLLEGYANDFGITTEGITLKVDSVAGQRPIKNKYVCIGVHSTAQCKYWNYPGGWDALCKMLRKKGLTPVVVERDELFGIEGHMNELPKSAVKKIGMKFSDVLNHIQHCEFYIGLSSGLSWVAQGLGKPTVIISNVTSKDNEFVDEKTLRIYDERICHGCIHKEPFDSDDWLWCPIYRNDDLKRHMCTKLITPKEVMEKIENFFNI
jgi:autotransporter strand-loop-strand O-heptosyltransferase